MENKKKKWLKPKIKVIIPESSFTVTPFADGPFYASGPS
jgi:hypothetical protein